MTTTLPTGSSRPVGDPALLPFLPALYLAWSDGELSREERAAICAFLDAGAIDANCGELLARWLDPDRQPTAEEFDAILRQLRAAAGALDRSRRRSLVELAADLAQGAGRALAEPERTALAALESALGLTGLAVGLDVLAPERPELELEPAASTAGRGELVRWLDRSQPAVRQEVRDLLARAEFSPPAGADPEKLRAWVLGACRELAARGFGGLAFAPADGGRSDTAAFLAVFETLAFGDLSLLVKFGVQFGLFGGSILHLGTERHHRALLPAVARLELPGCFAMTETGHGSNVADLETTATFDRETDELVVHTPTPRARKDYIGNAARDGRMATVFAQLVASGERHGVHAVLVPIRDATGAPMPGVTIEDCGAKLGLNGVDNGRLHFDRVRVPRANLLDRFAQLDREGRYASPIVSPPKRFFTMLGTLVGGRVSIGLAALSATKKALALAIRYGGHRRQFGAAGEAERVLLDYPAHQARLLPALATTYGLHFALRALGERHATRQAAADPEFESRAAGLKALATAHATATIQACREACGGQGYLSANRLAALKADTDVFTTFEGDNTVLLQLVAKHLLSGYRQQFGHLNAGGLFRYFLDRARAAAVERNPLSTHRTDDEHLLDRSFQHAAFRWREQRLVETLAHRVKRRIDAGHDAFDALADCQEHALLAAQAHIERVVLDEYAAGIASAPPQFAEPLGRLLDLFSLGTLLRERGFFLETGYLAAEKSKAIRDLAGRLRARVRRDALALVDGFGIPEECLDSPIARR
jgi:acyl-CoA oxidase